jgi:hypothetical protein
MKLAALLLLLSALAACGEAPSGEAPADARQAHAGPSSANAPEVGIELRRGRQPRELVRIGIRGVVLGPEGGPLVWKLFADPWRADDAWTFFRVYAPFRMKSGDGDLAFRGQGRVKAGPIERRMIFEWARQRAAEAAGGRGGADYGLVFAWHQGGPAGICENVVLYLTGEAVATACGWGREVRGRVAPGPLGLVYGWFDGLGPFQLGGEEASRQQGQLAARLIFAGRGARPSTSAQRADIQAFAASLFAELAARRRGAAPIPSRLLSPPGVGARGEVVLELPEKPPPPPRRARPSFAPGPRSEPSPPGGGGRPALKPPGYRR